MTTGTYNFVSVIEELEELLTSTTAALASGLASPVVLLVFTQFSDQLKIKITLKLEFYLFKENYKNIYENFFTKGA